MKTTIMPVFTLRDLSADVESISNQLMTKSGIIRKFAPGVHNLLPLGVRVLRNIENIIREEIEDVGVQEVLMASLSPVDFLETFGFLNNEENFQIKDKNNKNLALLNSNEELYAFTTFHEIKSYKQLPMGLYQFQKKFVNYQKPKNGLIKSREIYSHDLCYMYKDKAEMEKGFDTMIQVYEKILERMNLRYHKIEKLSPMSEDFISINFILENEFGTEEIVRCHKCGYIASKDRVEIKLLENESVEERAKEKIITPDIKTIEQLASFLNCEPRRIVKTIIYHIEDKNLAVLVRGDRDVNENKIIKTIGIKDKLELAEEHRVFKVTKAATGFAGPIGIDVDSLYVDEEITHMKNFVVGANETDYHYINVNYGRDFEGIIGDFKTPKEGDLCNCCGDKLSFQNTINLGYANKLGTYYSDKIKATFKGEDGKGHAINMSYFNLNLERIMAAMVEENNDDKGIIWPVDVAPFKVAILPVFVNNEDIMEVANKIYKDLKNMKIDVLLDDRDERVGVKFKDSDLMGIPLRVTIGKRIQEGNVEFKVRNEEDIKIIPIEKVLEKIKTYI